MESVETSLVTSCQSSFVPSAPAPGRALPVVLSRGVSRERGVRIYIRFVAPITARSDLVCIADTVPDPLPSASPAR